MWSGFWMILFMSTVPFISYRKNKPYEYMVTITLTFSVYDRNFFYSHIVWNIIEKISMKWHLFILFNVLPVVYKTRIYKCSNTNFPIWSVKVAVKFRITDFFFSCFNIRLLNIVYQWSHCGNEWRPARVSLTTRELFFLHGETGPRKCVGSSLHIVDAYKYTHCYLHVLSLNLSMCESDKNRFSTNGQKKFDHAVQWFQM